MIGNIWIIKLSFYIQFLESTSLYFYFLFVLIMCTFLNLCSILIKMQFCVLYLKLIN